MNAHTQKPHSRYQTARRFLIFRTLFIALAAPVRAFCRQASGKIKAVNYILVHHTSGVYENAVREMDTLLNLTHSGLVSVRCKTGKFKTVKCTESDTVSFPKTAP